MEDVLKQPDGLPWVLATGYVDLWKRLHRAEEASIEVVPVETVLAWAAFDEMRLQSSKIGDSTDLRAKLRRAAEVIDPNAIRYFKTTVPALPLTIATSSPLINGFVGVDYFQALVASGGTPPYTWSLSESTLPTALTLSPTGELSGKPADGGSVSFSARVTDGANVTATKAFSLIIDPSPSTASAAPAATAASPSCDKADPKTLARTMLRTVRRVIDEYRDDCWLGIVVARNRLCATMILTGLASYVLFAIAIIRGASETAITATAAFYLVGAIVGLLSRLRSESQNDLAVPDYGLSMARLITLPLISGLAGIGGVVLMEMLPLANATPAPAAPLTIATSPKLTVSSVDTNCYWMLQALGGSPPYSWSTEDLPGWLTLSREGKLSGQTNALLTTNFTAQVTDSTGQSVKTNFSITVTASPPTRFKERGTPPGPSTISRLRPLGEIFDLGRNITGLLWAAVFGLTPGLLFDRLQQQAERYKTELKSSEAGHAGQQH